MSVINVRVANLRKMGYTSLEEWLENPDHVYIGRVCRYVKGANDSKWKNPYPLSRYSREESLKLYEKWVIKNLWDHLDQLEGKTLGCWCKPESCHGDVLVKLLKQKAE